MNNQKDSKYNINDFLYKNIIDEIKDYLEEIDNTISISKNDYKYSASLNLIDAFWCRTNYILLTFNEIKNIDDKEWKFHLFILYCTNIIDGIKNIKNL